MYRWQILVIFLALSFARIIVTGELNSLTDADKLRLRNIVELKSTLSDNNIANIYYNVNLRLHLDKNIPDSGKICEYLKTVSTETLESIYFATLISKSLNGCSLDVNKLYTKLQTLVKEDSSVTDIYRCGMSISNIGKSLDSAKFSKLLLDALKREDTLLNTGLAFQLASRFNRAQDQKLFADKIADVVVQADEVNSKYLQFEGGLGVSAAVINGIYQLTTVSNKTIGITNVINK